MRVLRSQHSPASRCQPADASQQMPAQTLLVTLKAGAGLSQVIPLTQAARQKASSAFQPLLSAHLLSAHLLSAHLGCALQCRGFCVSGLHLVSAMVFLRWFFCDGFSAMVFLRWFFCDGFFATQECPCGIQLHRHCIGIEQALNRHCIGMAANKGRWGVTPVVDLF